MDGFFDLADVVYAALPDPRYATVRHVLAVVFVALVFLVPAREIVGLAQKRETFVGWILGPPWRAFVILWRLLSAARLILPRRRKRSYTEEIRAVEERVARLETPPQTPPDTEPRGD